jgi:hypothetical protein
MVRLALLAALAIVPSCLPLDADDDIDYEGDGNDVECNLNVCVTKDNPFAFLSVPRFGVGTQVPILFVDHHSLQRSFEIVASDPSVEIVQDNVSFAMRAHKAGSFVLTARNTQTQAELAHIPFDTAAVASIDFTLREAPLAPDPLTSIAALVGGTDSIGIAFRDGNGKDLAGFAPVAVADPTIVKVQASDWFVLDGPPARLRFGIAGLATGSTTATVTMFDGRTATLPIEVVDAAATLEVKVVKMLEPGDRIVPVAASITLNDVVYADLIAKTSDGRPVAGVYATWDATGPVTLYRAEGYATTPEVQALPTATGTIEITATIGDMTATATFTAH